MLTSRGNNTLLVPFASSDWLHVKLMDEIPALTRKGLDRNNSSEPEEDRPLSKRRLVPALPGMKI